MGILLSRRLWFAGCSLGTAIGSTRRRNGPAVVHLVFQLLGLLLDDSEATLDRIIGCAFAIEVRNALVVELESILA